MALSRIFPLPKLQPLWQQAWDTDVSSQTGAAGLSGADFLGIGLGGSQKGLRSVIDLRSNPQTSLF